MITLRYSTNYGITCQVFDDSRLIGRVRIEKRMTCDKFLAVIHGDGEGVEDYGTREFDTLFDALDWLEERKRSAKVMNRSSKAT